MYLLIDNSSNDKIIFHFCLNTDWVQREFVRDDRDLLEVVDQLLIEEKKQLTDLRGLSTIVGKGKFTATRVAATLVNTLAYALKIPVLGVDDFYPSLEKDIRSQPFGQYVSAQYSAPANIGGKK